MNQKIGNILKKQIQLVKPDESTLKKINRVSDEFVEGLKDKLKKEKIKADVFIGGSLAKNTLVKTDDNMYDVDIFVRFDKKYKEEELSDLLKKVFWHNPKKIHGSRDYYQLLIDNIVLEIIPVVKISKPEQARNVTDLSYFHVNYVLNNLKKNKKLSDEIILAKSFCHAQNCYGAESYIHGFSGYSIELLIIHYKSFLKFIKETADIKDKEKLIIDEERLYKDKKNILIEMNGSKIQGPVVLVDPTFKERNALSGLSKETFEKFRQSCKKFLKNPSSDFFIKKSIVNEFANYSYLNIVGVRTSKQKGDIAGTKSKKFFYFFINQLKKEFNIKKADFEYDEAKNLAYYYLVLENKKDELIKGPPITRVENLVGFRKAHPDSFIKDGFSFAHLKHKGNFEDFLENFLEKNENVIDEMSIKEIKRIK